MSFEWLNNNSRKILESGYLLEGETPEGRIRDIADAAEKRLGIKGFADKFHDYMSKGFYSLSSPVWSNYGRAERGLPISCFNSHCGDSIADIMYTQAEIGVMSKLGGGTSVNLSPLRPRGAEINNNGKTSGAVHFARLFEQVTDVVSQGSARRGRVAPYLDLEHDDADEFLEIARDGNLIQGVTTGVTVSDEFMESVKRGQTDRDKRNRKIWAKTLKVRGEIGFPYIFWKTTANNNKPQVYKDLGLEIQSSNLCSEISLPSSNDESFVCVLSSMNLVKYDEWKKTDAVQTMIYFLDTLVSESIEKLEAMRDSGIHELEMTFMFMKRAYRFLTRHRALGLGTLGYHTMLQDKMMPFESQEARDINVEIHQFIQEKAYKASEELADMFGEPEVLEGYGRRNTTLMAIAPTKSSSNILGGVSQGIEPLFSNYYIADLAKLKVEVKSEALIKVLKEHEKDIPDVWNSINKADGSVQHLDFLTEHEKNVFKTMQEINPYSIIDHAADRQEFIDQAQSLNVMVHPDMPVKEINALMYHAWNRGVVSLYYQYNLNASKKFATSKNDCVSCEA